MYSYHYLVNGKIFTISADSMEELIALESWFFSKSSLSFIEYKLALSSQDENTCPEIKVA